MPNIEDAYAELITKIKRKKKFQNNSLISIVGVISFLYTIVYLPTLLIQYGTWVSLFLFIFLIYFVIRLIKNFWKYSKLEITPKDELFHKLYEVYKNLSLFNVDRSNIKLLENTINTLEKIKDDISYDSDTFGFTVDKNLNLFLKMLENNITQYEKDLNSDNLSQGTLLKYVLLFEKITNALYNENLDELLSVMKSDYKEDGNKTKVVLSRILTTLKLSEIIKYLISLAIVSILSLSIISYFKLPVGQDLGSVLTSIVSGTLLVAGIKRFLIDYIENILSEKS